MSPEEIQGATMPYGWRTLSTAVSDDPEHNGISRLDEMMSGAVGVDMLIEWFVYCIRITVYVLQIVGVTPQSFRVELTGLFMWPGFIVS